jgi:hypothetical protein
MGKPVNSSVKRAKTTALNTKVNKKVFKEFKDHCAYLGYSMNVVLETFMQQYANGRFEIDQKDILKYKNDNSEMDTLNTTFNKEIYLYFKYACKSKGYFVKHVIIAFMEKFATKNYIMEYVSVDEVIGAKKEENN